MSLPWFRMYAEAVDDAKLRLLAFEDRWHFVALLCCKCSGDLEPSPLLRRKLAVKLGLGAHELDEALRRLTEVGLIDDETLQPLAWDVRQFASDSSTERTRAYRERHKKRHSDGVVTVQEADTEADTDTEEEKRVGRASRFKLSALPDDWAAYSVKERPDLDPEDIFENFGDYWKAKAGADARKHDWFATWRSWVRKERAALVAGKAAAAVKPAAPCATCKESLAGGWTMAPAGRVCNTCWRAYSGQGVAA